MSKTLVFGAMPPEATPETHIAAGPWCFAGQEKMFPGWETRFQFAPEPLANPSTLQRAATRAQSLCVAAIPAMAARLAANYRDFPPVYWQTLLAPWTINMAQQIVERFARLEAILALWQNDALIVPVLPAAMRFNFRDERDFAMTGMLGREFNHWLFSRLLRDRWPKTWQKNTLAVESTPEQAVDKPDATGFRALARSLMLRLPFPRLKGMSLRQSLRYSAALRHACRQPDHSLDIDREFGGKERFEDLPDWQTLEPLFATALPQSLKTLVHTPPTLNKRRPRLAIASIISYEDAAYRQRLAIWRARGNRLGYAQHGGNYGQIEVACVSPLVEYSQDVFFTWGWKRHGNHKGNFLPLPYPQLARMANKWHGEQSEEMIFVGTEMATYCYRLESRPTPLQFVAYRNAKAEFLEELPLRIRKKTYYRPYFDLPGTLADAEWLLPRFPEVGRCSGPLEPRILSCRLLYLDHPGTTLLEAMAANIPVICHWERDNWRETEKCEKLLDMLADCGVWQATPARAAAKVMEIWEDPAKWWLSPKVREAREVYCQEQALVVNGGIDKIWTRSLKKS